jgi:hypothetical protein
MFSNIVSSMIEADASQLEEDDGKEVLAEEHKDAGDGAGVLVQVLSYPTLTPPQALNNTKENHQLKK